jgi:hypothetical protein
MPPPALLAQGLPLPMLPPNPHPSYLKIIGLLWQTEQEPQADAEVSIIGSGNQDGGRMRAAPTAEPGAGGGGSTQPGQARPTPLAMLVSSQVKDRGGRISFFFFFWYWGLNSGSTP